MRPARDPVCSANMSRIALASVLAAATLTAVVAISCSKSAGSKDSPPVTNSNPGPSGPGVATPVMDKAAPSGGGGAMDDAFRLKPEEGQLTIEVPPDAVAGRETTARVVVTPSSKYKINFEFSTKLTLDPSPDVTVAKAELRAGGQAKAQGDAEKFEEKQLAFAVKLTPTKSGDHTIKGAFKFAVCDKDQCLAKKEPIAIQLAAK
jgi:hypothetical protein